MTRDFVAADGAAAYGRMGVSTQGFGTVCQWAIKCLNVVTGNLDREGGVLFTEPAVDTVGRGIVGPGHLDVWRSRVRKIPEFAGELPARPLCEEIETPGEGQIRADGHDRGQPGAVDTRWASVGSGIRWPRVHGRDRHLPQRNHPAGKRHPAAGQCAGA